MKTLTYKTHATAPGYRDLMLTLVDAEGQEFRLLLEPDDVQSLILACADVTKQIGDHPPIDWDRYPRTIAWPSVATWRPGGAAGEIKHG